MASVRRDIGAIAIVRLRLRRRGVWLPNAAAIRRRSRHIGIAIARTGIRRRPIAVRRSRRLGRTLVVRWRRVRLHDVRRRATGIAMIAVVGRWDRRLAECLGISTAVRSRVASLGTEYDRSAIDLHVVHRRPAGDIEKNLLRRSASWRSYVRSNGIADLHPSRGVISLVARFAGLVPLYVERALIDDWRSCCRWAGGSAGRPALGGNGRRAFRRSVR